MARNTIRNILLLGLLLLLTVMGKSCKSDTYKEEIGLTVGEIETFGESGGQLQFRVITNSIWTVFKDDSGDEDLSWFAVYIDPEKVGQEERKFGDGTVTVEVQENTGFERRGTVIVSTVRDSIEHAVTIIQSVATIIIPPLSISPTGTVTQNYFGSPVRLTIQTLPHVNWSVTIESALEDWLEIEESVGTGEKDMEITVRSNESYESREAKVTVKAWATGNEGYSEESFQIIQTGSPEPEPEPEPDPDSDSEI